MERSAFTCTRSSDTFGVFIQHAGKMLQALGYVGPIHVEMALDSLLGTRWLNPQLGGFFAERPGSALDDDVRLSLETTSEALLDQPDGVVIDLLRYVFFAVNWSGLVETQEKLENLVRVGHEFSR
jgi:hypothetical protein